MSCVVADKLYYVSLWKKFFRTAQPPLASSPEKQERKTKRVRGKYVTPLKMEIHKSAQIRTAKNDL